MDFENLKNWVGEHLNDIFLGLAIFLALYLAFGVGFLVGKDSAKDPIRFEQNQNSLENI